MAQHPPSRERPPPPTAHRAALRAQAVDLAVDVHKSLLEVPVIKRAQFLSKDLLVLETSHRSVSQLNKRSASQTLVLSPASIITSTAPLTFTASEVLHTSYSPNGKNSAVFRANAGKENEKERTIEIWDVINGVKLDEIEVGKEHGDWYFDDVFGQPVWHHDGHALLYTAELRANTESPDKFTFRTPDWGELFTGKRAPAIFLLLLSPSPAQTSESAPTPSLHRLTDTDTFPDISFGQPIFIPSDDLEQPLKILATGYSSLGDGRRLGIVYCANRPAAIYELSLEKILEKATTASETPNARVWKATSATRQSPEGRSSRSPRVIIPPPGASWTPVVIFLSNPEGGPHSSCASLHAVSLKLRNTVVLVDSVSSPSKSDDFVGIYSDQLPQRPFLILDGTPHVVFTSIWRSRRLPLLVSLANGSLKSLALWPTPLDDPVLPYLSEKKKQALKSISVLGTDSASRVVGLRSGLAGPPELVLIDLLKKSTEWKILRSPKLSEKVSAALSKIDWTLLPLPKFEPSEVLLISPLKIDPAAPATPNLPPLVTIPHGGPHSTYTSDFSAQFVALAIAGYRVALVNYPGSLGFGQDFVDSLPPRLGKLEVDATLATSHYLNTLSLASRTKGSRFFLGGSHGGFIGTHLSGIYPDEYDAVVLRNPVTDLASMVSATDIPDWIYAEAHLPYSLTHPRSQITPEIFTHLNAISPLTNASKVVVPTLLLVGEDDRRVPPDQSRSWYHALKNNKKGEVKMLRFPKNGHALDSNVETELVSFEAGLRWLFKFTTD